MSSPAMELISTPDQRNVKALTVSQSCRPSQLGITFMADTVKAALSPQAIHAINCYTKLIQAEQAVKQANMRLNDALVRMPDGDMVDYYLATKEKLS